VLVQAIVVAGDDPGADVGALADLRIAQISQVTGLCALAQLRLLGFNKVAHMRVFADLAPRPQVREWTDFSPFATVLSSSMQAWRSARIAERAVSRTE